MSDPEFEDEVPGGERPEKPLWDRNIGKIVEKSSATTDPKYGCNPYDRPLDAHIQNGIINLNKPPGPTSHEVVAWVKRLLRLPKAGHSGTLDPDVSGVLPVALGDATKILQYLLGSDKEYVSIMRLHAETPRDQISEVCALFQGDIYQRPPVRSNVKRRVRIRRIYRLEILEINNTEVLFRTECQAGTYVRKLCSDIGEALSVGAHMKELRRIRSGPFTEKEKHYTLHDLTDAYHFYVEDHDETHLRRIIRPKEEAFVYAPRIYIRDTAIDAICRGAKLTSPGIVKLSSTIKPNQQVMLFSLKDEAVALATAHATTAQILRNQHGIVATPKRVMMAPGLYPPHIQS